MEINVQKMSFDGQVLKRGFWLYVWKIIYDGKEYYYVGRTGDSSSSNAASPFNRIGQHLDFRENAKGNSLAKRLIEVGVDPKKCLFEMLALGPIYKEQESFDLHKTYRDKMATMEFEISNHLKNNGLTVLGIHHRSNLSAPDIIQTLINKVDKFIQCDS